MINKVKLLLLFIGMSIVFNNIYAADCLVKTYKEILVFPNNIGSSTYSNIFISNECNRNITKKLIKLISKSKGILTQRYINEFFSQNAFIPRLSNKKIKIILFNDIINRKKLLQKNLGFFNFRHVSNKQLLPIKNHSSISITCNRCNRVGSTSLYINFKNDNNKVIAREIINVTVKQKVIALFPKKQMNIIGKPLKISDFRKKIYYTKDPSNVLNIGKEIVFYKSNKQLSPLKPLKVHDITAINLISYGQQVKAILKSDQIKLEAIGVAIGTGTIGQNIRLKINNKTITAKIVDYNKVEISQ